MMRRPVIFFSIVLLAFRANASCEFTPNIEQAYDAIISLRFDEGKRLLDREEQLNPGNDLPALYYNYIDFLRAFISEEEPDFNLLKKKTAYRLRVLERHKENENAQFYLYAKAEILLQSAMAKAKFHEHVSAAADFRKAYRYVEKNSARFPAEFKTQRNAACCRRSSTEIISLAR